MPGHARHNAVWFLGSPRTLGEVNTFDNPTVIPPAQELPTIESKEISCEEVARLLRKAMAINYQAITAGPMTTFLVGKDNVLFHLHEEIVAIQSPALRVLVKGPMQEGITKQVTWDDVDPETFGHFASFVYSSKVAICPAGPVNAFNLIHNIPDPNEPEGVHVRTTMAMLLTAAKLYVLADKFDVRLLKYKAALEFSTLLPKVLNKAPRKIQVLLRERAGLITLIRYVYDNTMEGSDLRHLLVNFLVDEYGTGRGLEWCMELVGAIPDFGDELLQGFLAVKM